MTKAEYGKCEKLMFDAIQKVKQADEEYKAYNQLINNDTILVQLKDVQMKQITMWILIKMK